MIAFGIARAGEEFSEPSALEHHRRVALGTGFVSRFFGSGLHFAVLFPDEGFGVLAFRVTAACEELPVPSPLDDHELAAFFAGDVRGRLFCLDVAHLDLGFFEALGKGLVEILDRLYPRHLAFFDLIEFFFHLRGEGDIHYHGEVVHEQVAHEHAELRGPKLVLDLRDIVPFLDGGNDRRIGARPADAFFLERLHEERFREPRRRLGEVLFGIELDERERFSFGERRKHGLFVLVIRCLVLRLFFHIDRHESREFDHGARGPEGIFPGLDVDRRLVDDRGIHLACHETVPDKLVELVLIGLEVLFDCVRLPHHRRGTDGLVRLLSTLGTRVHRRLFRHVILPELAGDQLPRLVLRLLAHAGRVGPHVRNEADGPFFAHVHAFIQRLGYPHGPLCREAELAPALLLELACGERRYRITAALFLFNFGDGIGFPREVGEYLLDLIVVLDAELFLVFFDELCFELRRQLSFKERCKRPELFRHEGLDLFFTLADDAEGNGLHATPAKSPPPFFPEKGTELIAHEAVKYAPGLLDINFVRIDLAGVFDGEKDRLLGDLVEQHAVNFLAVLGAARDGLGHVRGNGLALAVRVGREQDAVRFFGGGLELFHDRRLALDHDVAGLEVLFNVNAELALRQVHDLAYGGLYRVVFAEILADGLCLCRRFYDDE